MLGKREHLIIGIIIGILICIPINLGRISDIRYAMGGSDPEISPGDKIKESQIKVYDDKIILDIENAVWASIKDTRSMEPFLNKDSHSIEVSPESTEDIAVGDIISYSLQDIVIIHRVVEIGEDEEGWYVFTKGDNLENRDEEKVRFEQIKGVVVGVLY